MPGKLRSRLIWRSEATRPARNNFRLGATAIRELHKGTDRRYSCGAGARYFGVGTDGDLYACHRFVEDRTALFGGVWQGVDKGRQAEWLGSTHVHFQSPCPGCWARCLCGSGCHHEVIQRGPPACDYNRGWLDYCLNAYVRIRASVREYFG